MSLKSYRGNTYKLLCIKLSSFYKTLKLFKVAELNTSKWSHKNLHLKRDKKD